MQHVLEDVFHHDMRALHVPAINLRSLIKVNINATVITLRANMF
jgi:hypothetical protein